MLKKVRIRLDQYLGLHRILSSGESSSLELRFFLLFVPRMSTLRLVLVVDWKKSLRKPDEAFSAMSPPNFTVEVVVENKPLVRDPEGETIHHNLIINVSYSIVTNVWSD